MHNSHVIAWIEHTIKLDNLLIRLYENEKFEMQQRKNRELRA